MLLFIVSQEDEIGFKKPLCAVSFNESGLEKHPSWILQSPSISLLYKTAVIYPSLPILDAILFI